MAWSAAAPPLSNELRVRHLRLRGPASQLAQAPSSLVADWSQAAWPIVGDDEVLLLRRVRVRAPAAALAQEAAAATRALASRAVDPWSPGAGQADALRFASRADYVAWRLHGLLLTPGPQAAERIAAVLCEGASALPVVWRRLRAAGGAPALDRLWRALDEPAAAQVLAAVAAATGWLPALRPPRHGARHDEQKERDHVRTLPDATALQALIGRPGQPALDARARLAALLAWWMQAPARLHAPDAAEALQAAAMHLASGGASPVRQAAPRRQQDPDVAAASQATSASPEAEQAGPRVWTSEPGMARADLPHLPAALPPAQPLDRQAPALPAIPLSTDLHADAKPESFVTRHGGLFWLIQVLALPAFQQRMARLDEPQAAWREWIRLAQALGAEPDDAWWAFAAQRSLLADHDPQAVRQLRWPADVAGALREAALQRFGQAALRAAIAERPARVVADEVRVEVHFRLADAQLEVRRAGLDVDPGWVPWLGCVLRWHFGSALAPQGEGSR